MNKQTVNGIRMNPDAPGTRHILNPDEPLHLWGSAEAEEEALKRWGQKPTPAPSNAQATILQAIQDYPMQFVANICAGAINDPGVNWNVINQAIKNKGGQ